ncbi:hypothetical protein [Cupriavidus neocaledonicus]|uniref:Uncharacterized protein n=1 Tax=Cupriavidus neocaledonicus TaxID=1040979 RepID=A0A375HPJ5_9BURK|nr:hypothetical protein [Cupriavidus neocaledonicus]SOZ39501.1 hypothetical protein CBM2605_B170051 [Cupriavidus neocaledonicus]SPD58784.1 protein of unknown function [Cupriavidus neocaledonicus]
MKILQSPIPQIIAVPLFINIAAEFCAGRSASQWQEACRLGNVAGGQSAGWHAGIRTETCRIAVRG